MPFTLVMEGPFHPDGPMARYEVSCTISDRQADGHLKAGPRLVVDSVVNVNGESISEIELPPLSKVIEACQLTDWAALNEVVFTEGRCTQPVKKS